MGLSVVSTFHPEEKKMQNAVAFSNNDVITVAWSYGKKPSGCMGFAIYRIDNKGEETPLPSHAVFKGYKIAKGQTTAEFPIQKFYWKDPYARLVAEKTGNRSFRYKVVPLEGQPGHLNQMKNLPVIVSNEVTISSEISGGLNAFFNRGLISTQRVSRAFKGKPSKGSLLKRVADEQDSLRASLSGDMVEALTGFVDRAKKSGKIYAALYELGDEELIKKLESLGDRLEIVLSNSTVTDPKTKEKSDGNETSRARLQETAKVEWNRIIPSNHIGHNKFLVYVDESGNAKAVLFGSTNWTPTGLCTQTNNTLVVEDPKLAERYLDYWKYLAADTKAAKGVAKNLQSTKLRTWDAESKTLDLPGGTVESWFSPNTPKPRGKNTASEKRPPDMDALVDRINKAQHAILFLAFYPGTPSIANWAADALKKNKKLFVRGCVTNKSASEGFYYELKGMTPPKKVKGAKTPIKQDPRVIGAEAFDGKIIPKGWQKEILNAGFAIIHDKIVVIDPFSDNCVVVTGSHNLGHKASFNNDENLAIIESNKKLAVAYATHVLDVYDHFAWRYKVKLEGGKGTDPPLKNTPDEWLNQYFDENGEIKTAQLKFWMQATG
jgi:phosphatidylserine/phosphatidylglycerophosphate/cardiolipin synthase-like enzyme